MRDSLVVAGLCVELAVIFWLARLYVREQNRADRAETNLWADLSGTRGTPIPLARPPRLALGQTTAPTQADLRRWDAAVDGLPWLRLTDALPMDVRPDPGSPTPKLAVTAPVSTARLRRLVAA